MLVFCIRLVIHFFSSWDFQAFHFCCCHVLPPESPANATSMVTSDDTVILSKYVSYASENETICASLTIQFKVGEEERRAVGC